MPEYKLTYFDVTGLGEPIRLLFSYGGIPFEDHRFNVADWPALKPKMPFGQVPLFEEDGKTAVQSVAIARYLAKKVGLAGKDDWEALEIDSTVDTFHDIRSRLAAYHYEKNSACKAEKEKVARKEVTEFLARLDAQVKENGGYFVGGALTLADLTFVGLLDYFDKMLKQDTIEKYENLKQLKAKVRAIPSIKAWIEKRSSNQS